ncbi:DUF2225 domain-containing protein [Pseudoalteromonas fuliginea]|uniref:DUF2225 domain-containing protein n=1 Tax=Pseudoalteromonas fuliginea TaxID=1872678 RepID=A0AB73BDS1_9GAMM|nr:tetratricopeptide repeat protein [Pseudoalteromonas fuliginea]KAA1157913.1 DUF2225 domain-containing protein [Pseudoalteromonas fuliginea]
MRLTLYLLLLTSLLVSFFWWLDEKGYEPVVVTITGLVALIFHAISKPSNKNIEKQKSSLQSLLSKNKNIVLDEVQIHILEQVIEGLVSNKKSCKVINAIESDDIPRAIELLKNDADKEQGLILEKWRKIGALAFFTDTNESINAFKKILTIDENNLEARLVYSDLLIRVGKYQEAIELLSAKYNIPEPKLEAMIKRTLGVSYKYLGDLERAEKMYSSGLVIANSIHNTQIEAEILSDLGLVYKIKGHLTKAKDSYNKSILLMDETNKNISTVYGNLAVIYKYEGNFEEAKKYYIKALAIDMKNKNNDGCARHNGNLGNLYRDQKNFSSANEYYQKSLSLYKKLGAKKDIALCSINIGVLHQLQGKLESALGNFQVALSINEEIQHKEGIGLSKYNIGSVQFHMGNMGKALEYLEPSLSIYEMLGAKDKVIELKSAIDRIKI